MQRPIYLCLPACTIPSHARSWCNKRDRKGLLTSCYYAAIICWQGRRYMSMLDHLLDHLGEGKAKYFPCYNNSYSSLSQKLVLFMKTANCFICFDETKWPLIIHQSSQRYHIIMIIFAKYSIFLCVFEWPFTANLLE